MVIGKLIGFFLGGLFMNLGGAPEAAWLGSLLGLGLGHAVDSLYLSPRSRSSHGRRYGTRGGFHDGMDGRFSNSELSEFVVALVVLSAKMAKADGRVSENEIRAFRRVVRIDPSQEAEIARIFNEAKKTAAGYEPYARRMRQIVADQELLGQVLDCLVTIARADGAFPSKGPERDFLNNVAAIFSLPPGRRAGGTRYGGTGGADPWNTGNAGHTGRAGGGRTGDEGDPWAGRADHHYTYKRPPPAGPYQVLGIPASANVTEIKKAYRELARKHHPDYLHSQGLSRRMIDKAHEEMVRINAAYDELKRMRGFS